MAMLVIAEKWWPRLSACILVTLFFYFLPEIEARKAAQPVNECMICAVEFGIGVAAYATGVALPAYLIYFGIVRMKCLQAY